MRANSRGLKLSMCKCPEKIVICIKEKKNKKQKEEDFEKSLTEHAQTDAPKSKALNQNCGGNSAAFLNFVQLPMINEG